LREPFSHVRSTGRKGPKIENLLSLSLNIYTFCHSSITGIFALSCLFNGIYTLVYMDHCCRSLLIKITHNSKANSKLSSKHQTYVFNVGSSASTAASFLFYRLVLLLSRSHPCVAPCHVTLWWLHDVVDSASVHRRIGDVRVLRSSTYPDLE
jgi:hypothetical protein